MYVNSQRTNKLTCMYTHRTCAYMSRWANIQSHSRCDEGWWRATTCDEVLGGEVMCVDLHTHTRTHALAQHTHIPRLEGEGQRYCKMVTSCSTRVSRTRQPNRAHNHTTSTNKPTKPRQRVHKHSASTYTPTKPWVRPFQPNYKHANQSTNTRTSTNPRARSRQPKHEHEHVDHVTSISIPTKQTTNTRDHSNQTMMKSRAANTSTKSRTRARRPKHVVIINHLKYIRPKLFFLNTR